MPKDKKITIHVHGVPISIISQRAEDFISLTDMAKKFGGDDLIYSWMRNRNTIEFLGIWEHIHNPNFKGVEFATFKKEAGLNSFHLTPKKWINATRAVGIQSRSGRYGGGTYAHKDLAFEFGSWLSPEFKLYLIKEFQRLKTDENSRLSLDWNLNRTLSKINYRIHTDAIKAHIIPRTLSPEQINFVYANEADVLNMALWG
ncbi:MAG: KilA-N domain-containing protein [Deltaproteobacteria bacterium]|nr:KilA-N domain-containing protein [Deltaproteobacteria bacterium]